MTLSEEDRYQQRLNLSPFISGIAHVVPLCLDLSVTCLQEVGFCVTSTYEDSGERLREAQNPVGPGLFFILRIGEYGSPGGVVLERTEIEGPEQA